MTLLCHVGLGRTDPISANGKRQSQHAQTLEAIPQFSSEQSSRRPVARALSVRHRVEQIPCGTRTRISQLLEKLFG
jgi:hypothetical protein